MFPQRPEKCICAPCFLLHPVATMSDDRRDHIDVRVRTHRRLTQIADDLGVPLATFFDNPGQADGTSELADTSELLRLWNMVRTSTDRAKLLTFARQLASKAEP